MVVKAYKYHGSHAIAQDIERQAQNRYGLRDGEFPSDVSETGYVDSRADVDGESEEANIERHKSLLGYGPIAWVLPRKN